MEFFSRKLHFQLLVTIRVRSIIDGRLLGMVVFQSTGTRVHALAEHIPVRVELRGVLVSVELI